MGVANSGMPSRRFRRDLAEVLPQWQAKGWLTPEGADALKREATVDSHHPRLGAILRAIFGAILVGGGLILLLAHNWDRFPVPVRVSFAMIPLVVSVVLGALALRKDPPNRTWAEGVGAVNSLSIALAISIVAQVYHISGDTPRFLLTWALASLPAAYLLRSSTEWVLFQVLAFSWAYAVKDASFAMPGYLGLLVLSAPFIFSRGDALDRPFRVSSLWIPLVLAMTIGLGACLRGVHHWTWGVAVYLAWFGLVLLCTADSETRGAGIVRWIARLGMGGLVLAPTFGSFWRPHPWLFGITREEAVVRGAILLGLLVTPLALVLARKRTAHHPTDQAWGAAALAVTVLCAGSSLGLQGTAVAVIANLVVATLAAFTVWRALRDSDTGRLNLGWMLFSALVVVRFFDTDWSYLIRGLVFITLGVGFLVLNKVLRRTS